MTNKKETYRSIAAVYGGCEDKIINAALLAGLGEFTNWFDAAVALAAAANEQSLLTR